MAWEIGLWLEVLLVMWAVLLLVLASAITSAHSTPGGKNGAAAAGCSGGFSKAFEDN